MQKPYSIIIEAHIYEDSTESLIEINFLDAIRQFGLPEPDQ